MKAIRHTLTERYYLWEDARTLAQSDPEVNLTGKADAYRPGSAPYVEEAWQKPDGGFRNEAPSLRVGVLDR